MFTVPGWAVSASSLVQEQARSRKVQQGDDVAKQSGKKRKRSAPEQNTGFQDDAAASLHNKTNVPTTKSTSQAPSNNKQASAHSKDRPSSASAIDTSGDVQAQRKKKQKQKIGKESSRISRDEKSNRITIDNATPSHDFARRSVPDPPSLSPQPEAKLTALQAKMRSKLTSARFRHLNEKLYTTTSVEALDLFTSSPELFAEYHAGFAQQVKASWPQNPVDQYVKAIKLRGAQTETFRNALSPPLPRRKTGSCTIADLGCGDAPLARGCQAVVRNLKLKFHNYDLHAANSLVTKADISSLPLRDGEADIAVFCLSLMGTNWISFVEEAWRILRGDGKGEVWVAEVKSRFGRVTKGRVLENSVGKRRKMQNSKTRDDEDVVDDPDRFVEADLTVQPEDETDIAAFLKVFTRRGFQLREGSVNKQNKMFVTMIFTKTGIPTAGKYKGLKWTGKEYQKQQDGKPRFVGGQKSDDDLSLEDEARVLKPCVYKIR